jgi:urease subunit alpha
MFGSCGGGLKTSITFVSQSAIDNPALLDLGLNKYIEPVSGTREITKADMIHNNWQPNISVDPETYKVLADGIELICEPARTLPLTQKYFLF